MGFVVDTPVVNAPRPTRPLVLCIDDFSRDGDARLSDYQALRAALEACRQRGASILVLPKRTYRFDDPAILADPQRAHIDLIDQKDLTIDGQGSELLFHHIRSAIVLRNCQRICLRNFIIDWDINLASPGKVFQLPDGRKAVRIPDDYPIGEKNLAKAVAWYDTQNFQWQMRSQEACHLNDVQLIEPQVIYHRAFDEENKPPLSWGELKPNMDVVVRHYDYQATGVHFGGRGNEDIAFEDITMYQCPGHAFAGYGCERGFRVSRVKIIRKPNSKLLVSATADGVHFGAMLGDIIVEDCEFSHMGDDSVNIHGTWLEVVRVLESRKVEVTSRWFNWQIRLDEGDRLGFYRGSNGADRGEATIVRSEIDMDRKIATLWLDRPLPPDLAVGDLGANITRSSARFLIRNNHFHDHRARGMLLQARQGLVENNRIRNVMGSAFHMTSDLGYWKEGYGCHQVIIRGNVMEGCNYAMWERGAQGRHMACLSLVVATPTGISDWPVHRDILIENNIIRDTPGLAMLISSARNVTVRNNQIIDANSEPYQHTGEAFDAKAAGAIMVTRSENVRVEGNRLSTSRKAHAHEIHIDQARCREVNVHGNTGFALPEPAKPASAKAPVLA